MKNTPNKPALELPIPPHIMVEDDTEFSQIYSPLKTSELVTGPCTRSKVLAALPESDRAEAAEEFKKGYKAVLMIDLETGIPAIEMRKHTPPSEMPPLTPEQVEANAACRDLHEKEMAFVAAILRQHVALKNIRFIAPKTAAKKGKK